MHDAGFAVAVPPPPTVVQPVAVAPKAEVPAPVAVVEKIEKAKPVVTGYDDAMTQGKQLAAQGDAIGARELFDAAAKLDRKAAAPHVELARLFIASDDRALAMAAANKAVKLAPESSQAWNTLGRANLARKSYDDAIAAFTKATELDETNVWAWNNLGFTHLEQKDYTKAAEALEQATKLPGVTGFMWNNLGTAYEQLDELDDARMAFAAGGKLGSGPALASAKRLVGVTVVAVKFEAAKQQPAVQEYDTRETVPEEAGSDDGSAAPAAGSDEQPAGTTL
jgi:tetratricopeptide (TPR) repeat protein